MSQPTGGVRASDADRDAAAEALAEAVGAGRLTLAEHSRRLDAMYSAITADQVAATVADLPSLPAKRTAMYRAVDPYKIIVVGGHVQRAGRFRIGRFCGITALFGTVDLDVRMAKLTEDNQLTITVRGLMSTVRIVIPKGWRVRESVMVIGNRQLIPPTDNDNPSIPILRLNGTMLGGSLHLTDA
ncbi:MAG TPA: DUF1707 domain-containing protein [Streptosporangiaceae bacterium]|nr:DUF1707 domain-containing protein [Streptosporangiaceae bacterium]